METIAIPLSSGGIIHQCIYTMIARRREKIKENAALSGERNEIQRVLQEKN